jgi:hypothetical protein
MKANSSGLRHATGVPHRRDERDDEDAPWFFSEERRSSQRELFVRHQQDLARRALHLGSPGAARAALRALYRVDFVDAAEAMQRLRVLRDPNALPEDVMDAMRVLVRLQPLGVERPLSIDR